jgi:hypothetical protein
VIACQHGPTFEKGNGTPKILPSESLPHPPALYPLESQGILPLARECFCEKGEKCGADVCNINLSDKSPPKNIFNITHDYVN